VIRHTELFARLLICSLPNTRMDFWYINATREERVFAEIFKKSRIFQMNLIFENVYSHCMIRLFRTIVLVNLNFCVLHGLRLYPGL